MHRTVRQPSLVTPFPTSNILVYIARKGICVTSIRLLLKPSTRCAGIERQRECSRMYKGAVKSK